MQYEADIDNFEGAIAYCQTAISLYKKSKDHNKIAHSTRHLADLQLEINQLNEAERNYVESINIYKNISDIDKGDFANALRGYALLLEKQNNISGAIDIWEQIIQLYRESSFSLGEQEGIKKLNHLRSKQQ